MRNARRSGPVGPLRAWAGDSLWRRFVVWLARNLLLIAISAAVFAVIWLVLLPLMIDGFTSVMQRTTR